MFTLWPSDTRMRVASSPAAENGTFTITFSCSVRSARPSVTIDAASRETTSADTSPSTSSQIRLMASPGSLSSLASREGFVVAPDSTPHVAISSTSATEPVSMKSLMEFRLLLRGPDPFQALVFPIELRHRALPAQHPADCEEVRGIADVVHAKDGGACVGGLAQRRQRAGEALVWRPAADRPDEVLARDRRQHRARECVQRPQFRHHRDRLRGRLGEVGPGIDDQLLVWHA